MTDFRHAMTTVLAELTPQPWEYTDESGATLTVIPAGLRADAGAAEVLIRATADKTTAAELGITTADMPDLIDALDTETDWSHQTTLNDWLTLAHATDGAVALTVDEYDWSPLGDDTEITVHLPAAQRLPLVSALRRALDVARGWETSA
jgi:hypothetical protein